MSEAYAAAREACAFIELPDRAVLAVTGPKRQPFLHGVLSHDVLSLQPGQGRRAALMEAKGHVQCFLRVLAAADTVWLELPRDRLEPVQRTLVHYRVAAPVRFQAPATAVLAVLGPAAREALGRAGLELPELADEQHASGSLGGRPALACRAGDVPAGGLVLHVAEADLAAAAAALAAAGAAPLDRATLDTLRVEEGIPWYGPDVTEANLLHETGQVAALHSPTKGCYVGQEVIARLEARGGHVNKALRGLRLTAPARAGEAVVAEGGEVGRLTTAGLSPRLGPVALAYVHRSRFEPGTKVEVGGAPATVARLPLLA